MRRTLAIVGLGLTYVVFAMLLNSVAPVILQSMLTFGVDMTATSTLDACKDLPIAATSILLAAWLPRLGYRNAMIIGLMAISIACLSMPSLASFTAIRLLFVVIGITFAMIKVCVYSSIGLLTGGPKQHASLTSLIEGLFMCGVMATSWVFSFFVNPSRPADPVWLQTYWLLAGVAATAALLWVFVPLDEERARPVNTPVPSSLLGMFALLRHGLVATFLAAAFVYVLIEQAVQTWLPAFNNEVLKIPVATSLQLASVYSACLAVGRLVASVLLRYIRWPVLLAGCLLAAALLLLSVRGMSAMESVTGWSSLSAFAFALPLIGLFLAPVYPTICSTMLSALPASRHAAMTGLILVFSALGGGTGSFIVGRVFGATGGRTAFLLTLVPMITLVFVLLLFDRQLRRPTFAAS